jgi:TM2 domain-containing membrane protein YozV
LRSAGSGYNVLMDKKLQDYIKYIEKESEKPSKELQEYHKTMVQQFQHERLIHLIVTLFFALFMILFFIFFGALEIWLPRGGWGEVIIAGIGVIYGILLVVTLFYVRHYFRLENGVQKLEKITKRLYGRE